MKRLIPTTVTLACVCLITAFALSSDLPAMPGANPQMSSANYALSWSAVGEISGGASASASYKMNSTIGQMAASTASASTNYKACSGFECVQNYLNDLRAYLPAITR